MKPSERRNPTSKLSAQSLSFSPAETADPELEGDEELEPDIPAHMESSLTSLDDDDLNMPVPSAPPLAVTDMLQRYLWEIRRYPLLSREEETELARHYFNTGDREAAAKLITSNLRLVVKIAMEHQSYWSRNLLDIIQEGNLGLIQALRKFDPFRNIKFSYYASFWINAYILKYIMDNWRLVRLGTTQAQRKLFYNLNKEKEKLSRMGITPEIKLLSSRLGVSEQDVLDMEQRLGSWEVSLDAPVNDNSATSQHNFMPDQESSAEEILQNDQLRRTFRDKLSAFALTLDEKERAILQKRLLSEEPVTLNELGRDFKVSRERVRQLQERLLKKLKQYLREAIPDFDEQFSDLAERD
ncbi:MAG: RNA polymerase factor sigma-32 [Desulfarculales bacterium]|jgi:RNA polymerase sigma-32 factor|nr:RNA polymerase factor sigma-32 [Desulfarculales bacterium]